MKRFLRALFNATLAPLLALILIFEEWGWEPLSRLIGRLARLPLWARMEAFIAALPPYAALVLYLVPIVLLLPVKLLALYWINAGHVALGLAVVMLAKIMGTAVAARLFTLTHPALMRLPWFARFYGLWKPWKDALMAEIKASAPWRTTKSMVRSVRQWIRNTLPKR